MPIREKRKLKGYSQSEISKKIGIPLRTFKRYEATENTRRTYKHDLIETQIDALPNNIVRKNIQKETVAILGAGNVGYPLGVLLNARNKVIFIEIDEEKNKKISNGIPLTDDSSFDGLVTKMSATSEIKSLNYCDIVFIALPTNYNDATNSLDTTKIEYYVKYISEHNPDAVVVIKSTVPIGFTKKLAQQYKNVEIIFAPEFLRESCSIHDYQYPDRMIFGVRRKNLKNKRIVMVMENICNNAAKTLFMSYDEAETVKLFSNSFLAMRIAYMNELDTFALKNGLNAEMLIKGMCLDTRIGDFYNNPSFGYAGHCFPKDVKELSTALNDYPLIDAIAKSNDNRVEQIAADIMKKYSVKTKIGFYKTLNKNYAAHRVADILTEKGYNVTFFETNSNDVESFINSCDLIVANRLDEPISSCIDKVYSRDIFKF